MKNEKTCCLISHQFLPFLKGEENEVDENLIKEKIRKEITNLTEKENVTVFYTGMEEGAELFAADFILSLKEKNKLSLNCVIPFEEQAADYSEESRDLYFSVIKDSDSEIMLNKKRTASCLIEKEKYMLERSDIAVIFRDQNSPEEFSLPINNDIKTVIIDL